jgi:hypothetical protein
VLVAEANIGMEVNQQVVGGVPSKMEVSYGLTMLKRGYTANRLFFGGEKLDFRVNLP